MNIISIQSYQQNNTFKAKKYPYNYVTKKLLEPRKISNAIAMEKTENMEKFILGSTSAILGIDLLLKEKGITYCEPKDNIINIGGSKSGDFYQINTVNKFTHPQAQEFIFRSLMGDPAMLGGFVNYKDMIDSIGRQDIIKKGLKLFTYTLNNTLSEEQRMTAARQLTHFSKIPIKPDNLFYIDSEAFYYDKDTQTVYGVNIINRKKSNFMQPAFRTCTFKLDKNGKTIGYKVNDWNWYHRSYVDKEYTEQQEPSIKLPPIAELHNYKYLAECYRFGNALPDTKFNAAIPTVLKHLQEKAGFDVYRDDLQLVKYYNDGGHIERKIAYYNPATGCSLVYNTDGKFIYQLEYNKDDFGNIIAFSKL